MNEYQDNDMLTINEVAEILGISRSTVVKMANNHELHYHEIRPSVKRFKYKDVRNLLTRSYRC